MLGKTVLYTRKLFIALTGFCLKQFISVFVNTSVRLLYEGKFLRQETIKTLLWKDPQHGFQGRRNFFRIYENLKNINADFVT